MKERLKNNLGLKFLSVFMAFFVWLLVVNVSDPLQPDSQTVTLEILNEDALEEVDLAYEISGKNSVSVKYSVHMTDSSLIRSADFRAYIDLEDCNVLGTVPVKVEVLNNRDKITDVTVEPSVIHVTTEPIQEKTFELAVKISGTAAEGYEPNGWTLQIPKVTVRGPESLVGQISQVGIEVNIDGAEGDVTGTASPVFYDANGKPLEALKDRVTVDQTELPYTVQVLKVRQLPLSFEVSGQAAEGYRYTGVTCDTQTISVIGLKAQLASVNSITIPSSELNVDGLTRSKTVTVDVSQYLPDGVRMASEDGSTTIEVILNVEKLVQKEFTLKTSDITLENADPDYEYEFREEEIAVTIQGLSEDLASLGEDVIKASVDVDGMEPDEVRSVAPTFEELGTGYQILEHEMLNLYIRDKDRIEGPGADLETREDEEGDAAEASGEAEASRDESASEASGKEGGSADESAEN